MTMNHEKCQSLYSVIPKIIIISLSLAGHTYWIRSWQVLSFSAPGPIWCATHLSHSAAREAMGNHEPERRRDDGMICWGHLSFKVWPKIFSWIETWKWANAWFQILIYIYILIWKMLHPQTLNSKTSALHLANLPRYYSNAFSKIQGVGKFQALAISEVDTPGW